MAGSPLLDHFPALEDPRQVWKVGHPLPEIFLVGLCATDYRLALKENWP